MNELIHQLKANIELKTKDLVQILKEKNIKEIETELEMKKIYNTVNMLKDIIAKNDHEKQIMRNQIKELKQFIEQNNQKFVYVNDEECKIKYETDDNCLKNTLNSLKNRIILLKKDVIEIKKQKQEYENEVCQLIKTDKVLNEKIDQLKSTNFEQFN